MSDLRIRAYKPGDATEWDAFCGRCINATFLHTRRFLAYHGDRFRDRSCIVEEGNEWLGILPAAEHPGQADCVVSHPGITYGGLLHCGRLFGSNALSALTAIADGYRAAGYSKFRYKAVPHIYQCCPAQDDLYALFRLGATRYRCDLSSTIDLRARRLTSERRKRGLRKARKAGIEVVCDMARLPQFWVVLGKNLAQRHGAQPVHTLAEMQDLAMRFPDCITLVCACLDGEVIAGTLLFLSDRVHHAQYIASNEIGHDLGALDTVFEHCVAVAEQRTQYFDFGISNEEDGWILNDGLYRFKTEFGGGGTICEFFELDLSCEQPSGKALPLAAIP
jgi:hypothetical protein